MTNYCLNQRHFVVAIIFFWPIAFNLLGNNCKPPDSQILTTFHQNGFDSVTLNDYVVQLVCPG